MTFSAQSMRACTNTDTNAPGGIWRHSLLSYHLKLSINSFTPPSHCSFLSLLTHDFPQYRTPPCFSVSPAFPPLLFISFWLSSQAHCLMLNNSAALMRGRVEEGDLRGKRGKTADKKIGGQMDGQAEEKGDGDSSQHAFNRFWHADGIGAKLNPNKQNISKRW